ncbi:MAG: hypothetical protein WC312_04410 [Candidatus Omnitrophota bacterium]|jgi:hypothetical protein
MTRFFKVLSAIIVIIAIGAGVSYAETIWEKRQKALKGIEEKQEGAIVEKAQPGTATEPADSETEKTAVSNSPLPLNDITIPDQYGSIIESYEGTNGKLIVHIQDAHANYEAQKNISSILESLIDGYGLNLILREGNSTDKDFSYLRKEAGLDARTEAAEKLLKDATITGVDYLSLTYDYPVSFQGIEDKALYDENKNALWEMDRFKDSALDYVNKSIAALDAIKAKLYNADLLVLDKAKKDYENEDTDLLTYYKALNDIMQEKGISAEEFVHFDNLMKINEMEQKIDLAKIRNGEAGDEEKEIYDEYQEALKKLNVNKLFREEPLLEDKIQEAISENPSQKKVYRISKAMSIMNKMLNVKVVPEEYNYFIENKRDFDPQAWTNLLKEKSDELGLGLDIPGNYYALSDNMAAIEKFYGTAGERDRVFVRKTEERMAKDNVKIAALVAGGFHTPTLINILADKGYSYVVISPRVTTETDENLYRSSLKND